MFEASASRVTGLDIRLLNQPANHPELKSLVAESDSNQLRFWGLLIALALYSSSGS